MGDSELVFLPLITAYLTLIQHDAKKDLEFYYKRVISGDKRS